MRLNFKRLALLAGTASRACAAMVGLTPARLDLLALIVDGARSQIELGTILCVSAPVVSRMVTALVELGLVQRRRTDEDRRLRFVELTARGAAQIAPSFDDQEHFLLHHGQRSAQCFGEMLWVHDWYMPLQRLGIDFTRFEAAPTPPFKAMRARNRTTLYARLIDSMESFESMP